MSMSLGRLWEVVRDREKAEMQLWGGMCLYQDDQPSYFIQVRKTFSPRIRALLLSQRRSGRPRPRQAPPHSACMSLISPHPTSSQASGLLRLPLLWTLPRPSKVRTLHGSCSQPGLQGAVGHKEATRPPRRPVSPRWGPRLKTCCPSAAPRSLSPFSPSDRERWVDRNGVRVSEPKPFSIAK